MTTYNGAKYLKSQLDSILNQTVEVFEVVVCDDGSTDETLSILKDYSKRIKLSWHVNAHNLGFVGNFEKAISLCTGEFIVLADQDDVWYPNKVEALLDAIGDNLLIHSDCDLIDEAGDILVKNFKGEIRTHKNPEDFLFANVVTGCTAMIRRELLTRTLPFPHGISYHDWYFAIHAAYLGRLTYTAQSLTGYRQHTNQDTGSGASEKSSIFRNCLKRLKGQEFGAIRSAKKQLANLLATVSDFSTDRDFRQKQVEVIAVLEEYINSFFHFSYGAYYAKKVINPLPGRWAGLFHRLKFSIG